MANQPSQLQREVRTLVCTRKGDCCDAVGALAEGEMCSCMSPHRIGTCARRESIRGPTFVLRLNSELGANSALSGTVLGPAQARTVYCARVCIRARASALTRARTHCPSPPLLSALLHHAGERQRGWLRTRSPTATGKGKRYSSERSAVIIHPAFACWRRTHRLSIHSPSPITTLQSFSLATLSPRISKLYTPHPTPYTLHPTPLTPHPTQPKPGTGYCS